MTSRLHALCLDAHDPALLAAFWGSLLGRDVVQDGRGALLAGSETQVGLRFTPSTSDKVGPNDVHLHLTSDTDDGQQQTVAAALSLGARHLDVGQLPEEGHIVLADPEGNELCVIEAGNGFLAGTGFLGELACDGGRQVGVFWAQALGWPLVWDQDDETAVQSPHGGTKVAWGGLSDSPKRGRNRQRFDLALTDGDLAAEVERLVALGATRLGGDDDVVELADPGGNEFSLVR